MDIINNIVTKINNDLPYDHITIPDNTKIIGKYCASNVQVKEFILPETITEIQDYAFFNCKHLEKINIPNNVTNIGERAFFGCEKLKKVILPKNIKKISHRAFADCKKLKKIVIPDGVEEIDWGAFAGCESLEEIVLPTTIKTLGSEMFLNCISLKKVTLPDSITHLPDLFFKGCINLNINLDSNIKTLGNNVFENCIRLTKFPNNITTFGKSCFKNCRSLKNVILNENVNILPDGTFDGCVNLENIHHFIKIPIGKRCFRNCKSLLKIPSFISSYNEQAFENCIKLKEINIIDSHIPIACFRGCTNLSIINNQELISSIGSFAFSNCKNLKEIDLQNISKISAESFSHCDKLNHVKLSLNLKTIGSRAFYNCKSLEDFDLPDSVTSIKREAFKFCHSIKKITIPSNLTSFGKEAFSSMNSLEKIYISPINKTFITPDNKILIDKSKQKLMLFASGCKDKSYSLKDYNVKNETTVIPITSIGEYAFSGNQNLEELTLCSCTKNLSYTAFNNCSNLKKLNIEGISFFSSFGFQLIDNDFYFLLDENKITPFPFEIVEFSGDFTEFCTSALPGFSNVENIIFPNNNSYTINNQAFSNCKKIKKLFIPKSVSLIGENAFSKNTIIEFDNNLKIKGLLEMVKHDDYSKYIKSLNDIKNSYNNCKNEEPLDENKFMKINPEGFKNLTETTHNLLADYTLYTLDNDSFYFEQNDKITFITKDYIDKCCTHSEEIRDDPALFLNFIDDLNKHDLYSNILLNGILISGLNIHSRNLLFDYLDKNDKFSFEVLQASGILNKNDTYTKILLENFEDVIDKIKILKKYNVKDPEVCHKLFMCCLKNEIFEELIANHYDLFCKAVRDSKITDITNRINNDFLLESIDIIHNLSNLGNNLLAYINLIRGKEDKDKFLLNHFLFLTSDSPLCTKLISRFDKNMKRLLKASKVLDGIVEKDMHQNFVDLLNLLEITGSLDEDPIVKQRGCTFITEKIFSEKLDNGQINPFRIVGDDIHRIFNFNNTQAEYNKEFATFFLENYNELNKLEKSHSGIIERIYKNFKDISKTCTSDKGSQRKLKVTLDKCLSFLTTNKFSGINEENKDLATLIGWWYDSDEIWNNALMVYNESLQAPRNIFTPIFIDENKNKIYDNNPNNDLKEDINEDFSYEWLPKQDKDNLVLGKYCNCCAHIGGAGQGIMRASMILDNCQNLVIRNSVGDIIAKSTIYVNKDKGYAVFNNVESSLNYRSSKDLYQIYSAFMRGTKAFLNTYNNNNPTNKIKKVTIGAKRNTILKYLEVPMHPKVDILNSLKYGDYSINNSSSYNGDWSHSQRLVLKK